VEEADSDSKKTNGDEEGTGNTKADGDEDRENNKETYPRSKPRV
jgi:hypothetical protein